MLQVILYCAVCFCATLIGAVSGIGGGIIIKPVLEAFSPMSISTISFLSGCTVLAMSAVSVYSSRKGEIRIDKNRGTFIAVGGAIGGVLGKAIFDGVKTLHQNDAMIGLIQNILMVILTLGVLFYMHKKAEMTTKNYTNPIFCLGVGLTLGMVSAFLGIGGGPINLAVLSYFFSMDTKTAALNSIYIILLSQATSLLSTIANQNIPTFSVYVLLVMVFGGIFGAMIGRKVAKKISVKVTEKGFDVLLVFVTLISVYNLYQNVMLLA